MQSLGMALKCTANKTPPASLPPTSVPTFLTSKEFRGFQQYSLNYVPGKPFAPSQWLPYIQQVGYTAPSKCPDIPPSSYMLGEASPLNNVGYDFGRADPNFESLFKFRVAAAEESAALSKATSFPGSLLFSLQMLPHVPWVWNQAKGSIGPTGKLSWSVTAAKFPTTWIYVDGVKVSEIPQQHHIALMPSTSIRTADQPRQTNTEEEAQRATPVGAQQETVGTGGSASGTN